MPVNPPAFSECLALVAAVIERRDGTFESGRSRNGIEICEWPWSYTLDFSTDVAD
jgi:hypothetical protein